MSTHNSTLSLCFVLVCLVRVCIGEEGDERITRRIEQVKKDLIPLDQLHHPMTHAQPALDFFKYYGLDVKGAEHSLGTFKSGSYTIAAHIFVPKNSKGTVIVAHGYFDHSGIWRHVIQSLVKKGFTVAIYDQPGHGLSGGERASIGDFDEYVAVLNDFFNLCAEEYNGPYHMVAHSTGCSAVIDLLLNTNPARVNRVVLIAPLIRSAAWQISGLGHRIGGTFIKKVPRAYRRNSSDKSFLEFVKQDPLQTRHVPLKWVSAHRRWCTRIASSTPSSRPIKIIQGTSNKTVSWKYNLDFLNEKFPNADISLIQRGGHQLINESDSKRQATLSSISKWLVKSE